MDYLNARFTGRIAATANSAMPLALTDNRRLGATTWSDELVERAGVDASRLPELTRLADGPGDRFAPMSPTSWVCVATSRWSPGPTTASPPRSVPARWTPVTQRS